MKHPLYDLCYRAYYNTSFTPEKRAESEVAFYKEILNEFETLCENNAERFEDLKNKFTNKFTAHMSAKSRCLSSMITGPAKFPVRRAQKANAAEHKRGEEVLEFLKKVRQNFDKEKNPHKYGISSDAPDAIELLKEKLTKLEKNQQLMKDFNKIARNKKLEYQEKIEKLQLLTGNKVSVIVELLKPNCFGTVGFETFELSNNNARIKTTKERIAALEAKKGQETTEQEHKGIRIVRNVEDNRIQLFFDGKPSQENISLLKSRGFKWSPSNGCWQRMLNGNGVYATREFLKQYQVEV